MSKRFKATWDEEDQAYYTDLGEGTIVSKDGSCWYWEDTKQDVDTPLFYDTRIEFVGGPFNGEIII